ncbi:hypothetical protein MMARJ_51370 (plasmid) [Mycobacterium marseillense]|uniref:Uncharacterized protein n=1 Tax=Mycobacterium marseillense TaxID=701042 RepID=A0ABM7JK65_9MYCO|nr:hypothetical protein MMARJ_51370 [Mycobacterium marseillense]
MNIGVLAVKAYAATRSTKSRALTASTPKHQSGQYEEGINQKGARHMSGGRRSMCLVKPAEHRQAWLDRYGDDYATDEERRAAYRDFKANLAELTAVFSAVDNHDNP